MILWIVILASVSIALGQTLAISNVDVVDVISGKLLPGVNVIMEGERIIAGRAEGCHSTRRH